MRPLASLLVVLAALQVHPSWGGTPRELTNKEAPPAARSASAAMAARRTASQFLRAAPAETRRELCTAPGARPGLTGLGEVLGRGRVDQQLLLEVVSNPHAAPHLVTALRALSTIDGVEGVPEVLRRLATARDNGSARGVAFELVAGACLRDRLKGLGVRVGGNEVDGVLADGTVVEMKDRRHGFVGKVQSQLGLRSRPGGRSMLVVHEEPLRPQLKALRKVAWATRTHFTILVADPLTLTARTILEADGRAALSPTSAAPLLLPAP